MTKSVLIHIGSHKTGSTSIQQCLFGYDDGSTFYGTFEDKNHSNAVYAAFCEEPENYAFFKNSDFSPDEILERVQFYRSSLVDMIKRQDREQLIISGEDISILSSVGKENLINTIRDLGATPKVVCYVREPRSFAASAFQQYIKSGFKLDSMEKVQHYCDPIYRARLEFFRSYLPLENLVVRLFRGADGGANVVEDFLNIAGLDGKFSLEEKSVNSNVSLSESAVKILYKFILDQPDIIGDPVMAPAFSKLASAVGSAYEADDKMPSVVFADIFDDSEMHWLEGSFDLQFSKVEAEGVSFDLLDYLEDMSGIDSRPLDDILNEFEIPGSPNDGLREKANRIFYAFIESGANVDAEAVEATQGDIDGDVDREDNLSWKRLYEKLRRFGKSSKSDEGDSHS